MNINIKGTYVFKQEDNVILTGENLITFFGESFFLNRCVNEHYNPIQYIAIGNAEVIPLRTDTKLGSELVRRTCVKEVDLYEKQIILKADFTASEVIGASEIGVYATNLNKDIILISHDIFNKINSQSLINLTGSVSVEYTFQFSTSTVKNNWLPAPNYKNVYYTYEPSNVIGVKEDVTGYRYVKSKDDLLTIRAGYYYEESKNNLYIRPLEDNVNPNELNILVEVKEGDKDYESKM